MLKKNQKIRTLSQNPHKRKKEKSLHRDYRNHPAKK